VDAAQVAIIAELRATNAALRAQLAALQVANQALEARRAELERRLGQDSSNASRPPSQDGLRKPTRHGRGEQSRRRPGKQPGTAGVHLARVADPDEVVVHAPARCGSCGGVLALAPVTGIEARQVFDLPELRLRVVEHRVQRRRCSDRTGHRLRPSRQRVQLRGPPNRGGTGLPLDGGCRAGAGAGVGQPSSW
jgi:hypothetical protein